MYTGISARKTLDVTKIPITVAIFQRIGQQNAA
jgi:hypothetical protein